MTSTNRPGAAAVATTAGRENGAMRAVVQRGYGTADVLHMQEIGTPEIGDGEVLVRVRAAGLDRGTWHMMTGRPYLMRIMGFGFSRPKNPVAGLDLAGTVAAVGSAVTTFDVGDAVYGIGRGSFAEYTAARADKLACKPANLTFEQAAAVPVSALTALQALRDVGRVESGQRVLIIGASGGVGSYAVQIAKAFGAEVTGVCSASKLDYVRALGAAHVVDYALEDFADGTHRYDLIVDIAGNSPLSRLRRALTPAGTLVIVGGESKGNLTGGIGRQLRALLVNRFVGQRLTMCASKERGSDLAGRLRHLIEDGKVTPSIDRTFPLDQVPLAMRELEAGTVQGKVVITL